jgi:ABC-type amino acid transport substrate-binding protein
MERRSTRRTLLLSALIALLPTVAAHAADGSEIPMLIAEQVDASGQLLPTPPLMTAVVQAVAAESGLKLVLRPYPWRRAQMMAENGEGLLFGAAITPERLQTLEFTKPLYVVNQWLVSTERAPLNFQQWDDLRGKVISISSGGKYGPAFEERRGKLFRVEQNATSAGSRLKMLSARHVDAVLLDSFRTATQFTTSLNCAFSGGERWLVAGKPVGTEPVLIAVPKTPALASLLPVLNGAIDRLTKSGRIQKLLDERARQSGC